MSESALFGPRLAVPLILPGMRPFMKPKTRGHTSSPESRVWQLVDRVTKVFTMFLAVLGVVGVIIWIYLEAAYLQSTRTHGSSRSANASSGPHLDRVPLVNALSPDAWAGVSLVIIVAAVVTFLLLRRSGRAGRPRPTGEGSQLGSIEDSPQLETDP